MGPDAKQAMLRRKSRSCSGAFGRKTSEQAREPGGLAPSSVQSAFLRARKNLLESVIPKLETHSVSRRGKSPPSGATARGWHEDPTSRTNSRYTVNQNGKENRTNEPAGHRAHQGAQEAEERRVGRSSTASRKAFETGHRSQPLFDIT